MKFEFNRLARFCSWIFFLLILFSLFSISSALADGFGYGLIIFMVFIPVICLAGFIGILNLMGIVVDQRGISRIFLGKVWQSIEWENIKTIKLFNRFSREDGRYIRCFNIHPLKSAKFRFLPTGKIVFNEKMNDYEKFVEITNNYLRLHNIKIECIINGLYTVVNKIN